MRSTYSQTIITQSYKNLPQTASSYKPKYMTEDPLSQRNSIQDQQINKLPLNLFLSPAQYNKTLITYGKNRKKQTPSITDGMVTDLEFVNDKIFEKIVQGRAKAIQSLPLTNQYNTSAKKQKLSCTCCCCQQYCTFCERQNMKSDSKLSKSQIKRALSTLDNEIATIRKQAQTSNRNLRKKSINKSQSQLGDYSRRAQSAVSQSHKKSDLKEINSYMNRSYQSKGVDISHLVMKSLIQFEQSKKRDFLKKKSLENTQNAKKQYLAMMNSQIRTKNLEHSRSHSQIKKPKSLSKNQVGTKYWNQIKDQVFKMLKNDNYSKTLKKQLLNYEFCLYEHKDPPKRQNKLTKEQANELRQKHAREAQQAIDQQIKAKQEKSKHIKQNLKSLDKQRKQHIKSVSKIPFRPTPQIVENAFKNIVEPKSDENEQFVSLSHFKKNNQLKKKGRSQALKNKR